MKKVKVTALILLLILISTVIFAAEKGDFNHLVPQYDPVKNQVIYKEEVYKFDKCLQIDKDDDKVNETTLCRFLHTRDPNKRIFRYTLKDINWAWGVFGNNNREDEINNFAIIDSSGKNGFDTRVTAKEVFYLPDWVKKAVSR